MSKQVLFTMFGATGDLAKRKLYPALFQLYKKGEIAENFAVIGTARRPWTDEYYRQIVMESLAGLSSDQEELNDFSSHFYYQSHDVNDSSHYHALKELGDELREKYNTACNQAVRNVHKKDRLAAGCRNDNCRTFNRACDSRTFASRLIQRAYRTDGH